MNQWPSWLPLRQNLQELSAYGAPQLPADAVMNTNENPYPPSAALAKAIADRISEVALTLNRYPDRDALVLRGKLADFINGLSRTKFGSANVWAANGSNEIIQSLFMAFGGGTALGFTPSYSMHPLIAKVTQVQWLNGNRREDFTLDIDSAIEQIQRDKPTLTFITTPNNPTGSSVTIEEIEKIAKSTSGLLIVDEAYAEFSDEISAVTLIEKYPHVVVIRTMSKAFAFAGARLGYLVADKTVVDGLKVVRLPYHLSSLTQAAALVALENAKMMQSEITEIVKSRQVVKDGLEKLGLKVIDSGANFLFFTGFKGSSEQLWQQLLDQQLLVRDVGYAGYLRVSIGTESENQKFLQSIKLILG